MGPGQLLALLGTAALTWAQLDLETPSVFRGDPRGGFGASLAQLGTGDRGWLLVGAPLEGGGSGSVFGCAVGTGTCREIPVTGPPGAANSSLGLALAAGESTALVCGPTSAQVCGANVHLSGFCVQLDTALRPLTSLPAALPECPQAALDVAFLMDGSGSIGRQDFQRMLTFIAQVMAHLSGADVQFSLTQFSYNITDHFDFRAFRKVPDPARLLRGIEQERSTTRTASGIRHVLQEMFVPGRGARPGARRVLVVVTDGERFDDPLDYPEVIPLADSMAVTRYAIGVGSAFRRPAAFRELQVIASSPARDHLFRVDNFQALDGIRSQLQERIFAIEGTHSAHSSSFQLEMAQEGFSATVTAAGPVLGAVGAFDWSGGAFAYGGGGAPAFLNGSAPYLGTPGEHLGDAEEARDGYLGYSATPVALGNTWGVALGAPRYAHLGRVLLLRKGHTWELLAQATGTQVGSYFGASLLALEPCPGEPRPGEPRPGKPRPGKPRPQAGEPQVRLLVGAPLFYGGGSGGRVHLCELDGQSPHLRCHLSLRGSPGQPLGRFGASLAHLAHLGGATCGQVVVGAPLEDEGRGAIYLFRCTPGGVSARGAQRIPGSRFPSQPHFFGQSLSGGRDLSGDHLPDLAVGALGQVLLLRSPPLLQVKLQVSFEPQVIPARECPEGAELREQLGVAKLCFRVSKDTPDTFGSSSLRALLSVGAELDPGRTRPRAALGPEPPKPTQNGTLGVGLGRSCQNLQIFYSGCPQDTLTPLSLRVTLGGLGEPLGAAGGLRPQLSPSSDSVVTATLPFEHDCGADNACQDRLELQLELNRGGQGVLLVGEGQGLEVTLTVTNEGESSFSPGVTLSHPPELSYRKVQVLQARPRPGSLRCHSEPPEGRGRRSRCHLQPPVLRAGGQVSFRLTLDVPPDAELGETLQVTAESTSTNGGAGGRSQSATIPVRYQVFVVIDSAPDSTRYLNVSTRGAPPPPATVTHHYQVKVLGGRALPANVTFWVPSHLGQERLWDHLEVTPEQEQPRCRKGPEERGEGPERPLLVCPGAPCWSFRCSLPPLQPPRTWGFHLAGKMHLERVRQMPWPKVHLLSSAQVSFDQRIFQNTWGGTELQVQTELERVEPPNPLPLILGASLGGLLLLGLLALGLYKLGFFRRRYREMLEGNETPGETPAANQLQAH